MDVGLGDGDDLHAVGCGQVLVDGDVAAGVDDDRLALGLAADQVAGLGEVFVIDALDKHVALLGAVGKRDVGRLAAQRVGGKAGALPGDQATGHGVCREACLVQGLGNAGAAVAAAADGNDGTGPVKFGQPGARAVSQGNVEYIRDHPFGDLEVLADVKDLPGAAAFVGFSFMVISGMDFSVS